ncbi:MAG: hypothetical protein ACR2HA_03655 [Nocardioides sp.]
MSAAVMLAVVSSTLSFPAEALAAVDDTPPTGDFVLISAVDSESQGPLVVEVVQNALFDDKTPDADIVRDLNWGEGNGFRSWPDGDQVTHAYDDLGTFAVKVRLRDMAGNRAVMVLGNVTVVDRDEPTLRLDQPRSSTPHAWRTVNGRVKDPGVGSGVLRQVRVKAYQHRARGWFAYDGDDRSWSHVGEQRKQTRLAAVPAWVRAGEGGTFSMSLRGLRPGRLVIRADVRDESGNRSPTVVVKRSLHH